MTRKRSSRESANGVDKNLSYGSFTKNIATLTVGCGRTGGKENHEF